MGVKERMKAIEETNAKLMEERKSLLEQVGGLNRRIQEIDAQALQQVGAHNALKELLADIEKPIEAKATETEN